MNIPTSRHRNKKSLSLREERATFKAYSRVCLVVFIGTVVSLILFMLTLNHSMRLIEKDFRHDASQEISTLNHKIQVLDQFWHDIRAFYASSEDVTRPEFKRFTSSILINGDLTLISWIPAEKSEDIKPEDMYIEAKSGIEIENAGKFLAQQDVIITALRQAQTTEDIIVHPVLDVPFVRETPERTRLAIVVPLASKGMDGETEKSGGGFILALLSTEYFFADVFIGESAGKQNKNISIHLIEGADSEKRLLFKRQSDKKLASSSAIEELSQYDPVFSVSRTLAFGSAHLEIKIDPSFSYLSQAVGPGPWVVLILVMILTGVIAFWFYQLINRNLIITKTVKEKTQALALSEQRVRSIIDHALDAIVAIDQQGKITEWNERAEQVFGWSREEVEGHNMANIIIPHEYRERHHKGMRKFLADGSSNILNKRIEIKALHKNGTVFPVELAVTDNNIHGIYHFTAFIRDITEQKEAEKQIQNYMEELKRSNDELDDFVYVVSHDLKEPLRGLYSYSQFLQEDYGDKLDEAGADKLETLKRLAIRMQDLIDRLLYYSRLGRGEMAFQNTDLNKVVQELLEMIEPSLDGQDVKIDFHDNLPVITCDSARVGEVFRNLITNAVKYNDKEHKHVEIGCTTHHEKYPEQYVFFVADNGIGIEEKHKESVFKMFKRLHGREEYGGGTGSGLTIAKKIIDRHGGDIWIESNAESGTTFYFTLEAS